MLWRVWFAAWLVCLPVAPAREVEPQEWKQRIDARASELRAKNGTGTDKELERQLLAMFDEDQAARGMRGSTPDPRGALDPQRLEELDVRITAQLKQLVAAYGWPTMALVGPKASQAAILMLVHSRDREWQERTLPELQRLVDEEKIFPSDVATLTDAILVSSGRLQRFGTRFVVNDREVVINPIEDPARVEERRARYLLPPMDVYRKLIESIYHLPVK